MTEPDAKLLLDLIDTIREVNKNTNEQGERIARLEARVDAMKTDWRWSIAQGFVIGASAGIISGIWGNWI